MGDFKEECQLKDIFDVDWNTFWERRGVPCRVYGIYVTEWEDEPDKNPIANDLAKEILCEKGIENAEIVSVSPALFWCRENGKPKVYSWLDRKNNLD